MPRTQTVKENVRRALVAALAGSALGLGTAIVSVTAATANAQPVSGPLTEVFTYQGELSYNGVPVDDDCDFVVRLFDGSNPLDNPNNPAFGDQIGSDQSFTQVPVVDGKFTLNLDFDPGAFTGDRRFLQIDVRCPGSTGNFDFERLWPRQEVHAAPYGQYSLNSGSLGGVPAAGYVEHDEPASVTAAMLVDSFLQSINGLAGANGNISLVPGSMITISDDGNGQITISAQGDGVGVAKVNTGDGLTGGGTGPNVELSVPSNAITTAMLRSGAVTASKIASNTIGHTEIDTGAVRSDEVRDGDIRNEDLADNSVTGAKIASDEVRAADLRREKASLIEVSGGIMTASGDTITVEGASTGSNNASCLVVEGIDNQLRLLHSGGASQSMSLVYNNAQGEFDHAQYGGFTIQTRSEGGTFLQTVLKVDAYSGKLTCYGDALKPGGGSWDSLSDRRMKRNITPLDNALNTMLRFEPVTYEYTDPSHPLYVEGTQLGLVAQDVEQVMPDWVSEGSDGFKRLSIKGFESLTIGAFQDVNKRLAALEAQNAELSARNAALLARLDSMMTTFVEANDPGQTVVTTTLLTEGGAR